uniref:Immunoglobulin I-set domain-containing protein n=1 Tax=Callorhinchus milii TaxID=7868 RepID=A0A4W3J2Z7_CALMI
MVVPAKINIFLLLGIVKVPIPLELSMKSVLFLRRYKVRYNKETGECQLEISMTFADDAGEYSIVARNQQGEVSASAQLLEEDEYEVYMKQHQEVTYRTEISTQYVQEPKVAEVAPIIAMTEYDKEQILIRKKMGKSSVMMKTVTEEQEYHISAFEERLIKEIEFRIIKITLEELLEEDGEVMSMDFSQDESIEPGFDSAVKSYRILEGRVAAFHCKLSGYPLPKVSNYTLKQADLIRQH